MATLVGELGPDLADPSGADRVPSPPQLWIGTTRGGAVAQRQRAGLYRALTQAACCWSASSMHRPSQPLASRPTHPQTCGKLEHHHRTYKEYPVGHAPPTRRSAAAPPTASARTTRTSGPHESVDRRPQPTPTPPTLPARELTCRDQAAVVYPSAAVPPARQPRRLNLCTSPRTRPLSRSTSATNLSLNSYLVLSAPTMALPNPKDGHGMPPRRCAARAVGHGLQHDH